MGGCEVAIHYNAHVHVTYLRLRRWALDHTMVQCVFPPRFKTCFDARPCRRCGADPESLHPDSPRSELPHSESRHCAQVHSESLYSESLHSESLHSESLRSESLHSESLRSESLHSESLHSESLQSESLCLSCRWLLSFRLPMRDRSPSRCRTPPPPKRRL